MKKLLLLSIATFQLLLAQSVQTPADVLTAMHDRYANKWYKTLTFEQKTTQFQPDSTTSENTWFEAFSFPGMMRIDMDSMGYGGMLLTGDSLHVFRDGALTMTHYFVHSLLLLGFDVYFLPPPTTLAKLAELKINLSLLHEDEWQGRPVYVVGAERGDLHTRQFWVDKERLCFVRLLEPAGADGSRTRETQFNKFQKLGGGWIATEVVFKVEGKVVTTEEYSKLRANPRLDMKLFDPAFWKTARW